jgi:ketosteroid isomerase-like protein/regulator of sirC expression with transglutaminase-like and TPR domain
MAPPRFRPLLSLLLAAGVSLAAGQLRADSLQDAQRLLKQGQFQSALEKADQALAAKPKDAQARFLKGLILTEMNRPNDAIAVFTQITEDYPELPEPYNNLAVIYAQMRQYDKAKAALEMAIRTHPSYATAHENLGDIYARLASQAYDKALQLDSSNTTAQNKLAMIRELMSVSGRPAPARVAVSAGTRPAVVATAPAAAPGAPPPSSAAPPAAPAVPAQGPAAASRTAPAADPGPDPAKPAVAKPVPSASSPDIEAVVKAWAGAWSRKDVKAYLAYYARDFTPPDGQDRAAWERERRRRIDKRGTIQVEVENLRISQETPDRAVARFRQHYRSQGLDISSNKSLLLLQREGRWQIQQERVGS